MTTSRGSVFASRACSPDPCAHLAGEEGGRMGGREGGRERGREGGREGERGGGADI